MNYPEEIREKYNECMYEECDIIKNFLEGVRDLRKGFTCCSWKLEKPVEVVTITGGHVNVLSMRLDSNNMVVFFCSPISTPDKEYEWKCDKFAYGELSKVIEELPSIDEIIKTKMMADIKRIVGEETIVWMTGKTHIIHGGYDILMVSPNGFGSYKVTLRRNNTNSDFALVNLNAKHLTDIRNYLYKDKLQHSPQYKEVMNLLASEENLRVDFNDYVATFLLKESAAPFTVSYIQRTDKGDLTIGGEGLKSQSITLAENDIEPEYLDAIIPLLKKRKWEEIMKDGCHDPELIRKINEAWNNEKYHELFEPILFAIAMREYKTYEHEFDTIVEAEAGWAMRNAHNILSACAYNSDLKAILLFIGYEEQHE
jgi:hypothetical protein